MNNNPEQVFGQLLLRK